MRTTVTIDDGLWHDARRHAEAAGQTFSALVEEALRARLATPASTDATPAFRPVRR